MGECLSEENRFNALIAQRAAAVTEREALRGELKVLKIERDLFQEKLNAFLRKLFVAKSEMRGNGQSELFNEAEALASVDGPVTEKVPVESGIEIAGHTRQKRGRKPLDPALPREIVRHELPESERISTHDGKILVEIGVETSEQLDIIPQQVRVIQHQRVKYACRRLRTALALASDLGRLNFTLSASYINSSADGMTQFIDRLPLSRIR